MVYTKSEEEEKKNTNTQKKNRQTKSVQEQRKGKDQTRLHSSDAASFFAVIDIAKHEPHRAPRRHQENDECKGLGSKRGSLRTAANKESSCAASTPPFSAQKATDDVCCMASS